MKLNIKNTIYASLAFGWITIFWFGYDNLIQTINIATFGLRTPISGLILAIDNILGLLVLPVFGWLSDRSKSRLGKRTPYILAGTLLSMVGLFFVGFFAHNQNLTGYLIALVVTLFGMAAYRSPALSLVPDITPEPLRSKANAVSNLVSALFNLLAVALVTPFLVQNYIENNNYFPIIIGIVVSTFVTVGFFLWKVKENKLLADLDKQLQVCSLPENKEKEVCNTPSLRDTCDKKARLRNKLLLLTTIFFFYMAYNALVSNFTNYAHYVLNLEFRSLPLIVVMGGAIVGFALTPKFTKILGRKKTIFAGFIIMITAFLVATLLILPYVNRMPTLISNIIMNICFAVAGFGYGFVMVNIYPMFLEFSGTAKVGQGTGIFAMAMTVAMVITPVLSGMLIEQLGILTGSTYSTTIGSVVITNFGDYRALIPYSIVNLVFGAIAILFVKTPSQTSHNKDITP